jgi:hypothetical protein
MYTRVPECTFEKSNLVNKLSARRMNRDGIMTTAETCRLCMLQERSMSEMWLQIPQACCCSKYLQTGTEASNPT